jgi:DNA-directed RNA polymerase subunit RPC12/RpoP
MKKQKAPKILLVDIETAPLISFTWGLFDQNIPLNMLKNDWHLLSFSAKWIDSNKVMYMDQRNENDITNDFKLLKGIWKLLDEADIIITQNGISFDIKKLNARFIINGMKPPSSFKQIDTLRLARKHFGFTSNKLEYLTNTLNKKHRKSGHKKFSGFELWKECLAGNIKAWKEMEKYNKLDVLSLEELYKKLIPWDSSVNFNLYHNGLYNQCKCGSRELVKYGFAYTNIGKFQRYQCKECGAETRDRENLLDKDKRSSLQSGTKR